MAEEPEIKLPTSAGSSKKQRSSRKTFNISPSNGHSGLISFRMDLLDLFAVQGTFKSLLPAPSGSASPSRLPWRLKTRTDLGDSTSNLGEPPALPWPRLWNFAGETENSPVPSGVTWRRLETDPPLLPNLQGLPAFAGRCNFPLGSSTPGIDDKGGSPHCQGPAEAGRCAGKHSPFLQLKLTWRTNLLPCT